MTGTDLNFAVVRHFQLSHTLSLGHAHPHTHSHTNTPTHTRTHSDPYAPFCIKPENKLFLHGRLEFWKKELQKKIKTSFAADVE